jgi:hypothetical protein
MRSKACTPAQVTAWGQRAVSQLPVLSSLCLSRLRLFEWPVWEKIPSAANLL